MRNSLLDCLTEMVLVNICILISYQTLSSVMELICVVIFMCQFGTFHKNGPNIDYHITDYCNTCNINLLLEQTSTNIHHGVAELDALVMLINKCYQFDFLQ